MTATELGAVAASGALARSQVDPEIVDPVIFGNVVQTREDAPYLARHIGLMVGVPLDVPGLTVNRLCASGLEAMVLGAQQLLLGDSTFVLAGGTENMTQCPHASPRTPEAGIEVRPGHPLRRRRNGDSSRPCVFALIRNP